MAGRRIGTFAFLLGIFLVAVSVEGADAAKQNRPSTVLAAPSLDGCSVYPADNIWNAPVDQLPLNPKSAVYINSIGANGHLHPDFGSGVWPPGSNAPIGIPYITVPGSQTPIDINFTLYGDESDPGPYPIPLDAPIEGGPDSTGDRHVLAMENTNCILYELYYATPNGSGGWDAGCGALYDLKVNGPLRTDGFTSADAAGLPILPGLIRYDEVTAGAINHAIRFTASNTQNKHVWPARHDAGDPNSKYPPMGARLRLKADYDISGFSPAVQVILQALKTYGMILADNGSSWYLSGAPNEGWDNDVLHELGDVPGSAFEVVDSSVLMVDPDSGQASSWPPPPLFSDYFPNGELLDWTATKGTWGITNDAMTGTSIKTANNFPNAFSAGCSSCLIDADMQMDTSGARASLLGWYKDNQHYVEIKMMDDTNKVLLKQRAGSTIVKKSVGLAITTGVNYRVRVRYSNGMIIAEFGGLSPTTIKPSGTPSGTVGFRIKSTTGASATGTFAGIVVY